MKPGFSIVIPMHNEEGNVDPLMKEILNVSKKEKWSNFEIVPVNDVSTDRTGQFLESWSRKYSYIRPVHRKADRGPGNALRAGFAKARGDVVISMDGDLSHQPKEIPLLLRTLEETGADIVLGSRYIKKGKLQHKVSRKVISRLFNLYARAFTGVEAKDLTTGFRAHKNRVLKSLDLEGTGFEIHVEIPTRAHKMGYKVVEAPIHYAKRRKGKSKLKYTRAWIRYGMVVLRSAFSRK